MTYRKKDLDAVELGEELLLCEKTSQKLHRLNSTAAAIWKLCDGQKDMSEIAKNVAREFPGPSASEIEADVRETLSKMKRLGIVDGSPTARHVGEM
ncbi:MAG: PqqD family protein [bacterium]|nr:PqqD family protein [bacterium]